MACLLALGIFLAAAHNRAVEQNQSSAAEKVIRTILSPFQSAIHAVRGAGSGVSESMRTRGRLLRENKALRGKVSRLYMENARLREERKENQRLRIGLEFKKNYPMRLLSAQVIARGASRLHETCTIDRGSDDGVWQAYAVITPQGLVGQVLTSDAGVAEVLLLTDQSSGVGAIAQRSRVNGICQGQHTGYLVMNYLDKNADVKAGDMVVTSGVGKVYPKGIPIGCVTRIKRTDGFVKSAEIKPAVQFDRLEEAFVIIKGIGE
ncbi:MAG: rod shape-determining protein MreC [Armatimonadota bacterium]|nr:rod shape-determining protein MreC [Armatimonadota bacterium]